MYIYIRKCMQLLTYTYLYVLVIIDVLCWNEGKNSTTVFDQKTDDELDAGFQFMDQHAPRSSSKNMQLIWTTKCLRNKECPIFGWPLGLVEKALRNLSHDGSLAKKRTEWGLVMPVHYNKWVGDIFAEGWDTMWISMRSHTHLIT